MIDQPTRRRGAARPRFLLSGALLALAASGCALLPGGGGDDDASGGPISDLLAYIPDTPGNRQQVQITDHAGLARAAGLDWPLADGPDGDASLAKAVLARGEVLVPGPLLLQLEDPDAWRSELGFTAADVDASAEVGVPPSVLSVFHTTVEPSAIADTVAGNEAWSADLRTTDRDGVTVYSWGDDPQAVDVARTSAVRKLGQGGVMAVAGDGLVLWATDPTAVDGALAVRSGDNGTSSLADDDSLAAVARALDRAGSYTAFLSDRMVTLDPLTLLGPRASPAAIEQLQAQLDAATALPPYRAIGIGNAIDTDADGGQGYVVFAFATGSDGEAKALADAFTAVVAGGTSAATNRPWSELLTVREATTDGSVTVITVDTERLSIGLDAYQRFDTLLAARPEGTG